MPWLKSTKDLSGGIDVSSEDVASKENPVAYKYYSGVAVLRFQVAVGRDLRKAVIDK